MNPYLWNRAQQIPSAHDIPLSDFVNSHSHINLDLLQNLNIPYYTTEVTPQKIFSLPESYPVHDMKFHSIKNAAAAIRQPISQNFHPLLLQNYPNAHWYHELQEFEMKKQVNNFLMSKRAESMRQLQNWSNDINRENSNEKIFGAVESKFDNFPTVSNDRPVNNLFSDTQFDANEFARAAPQYFPNPRDREFSNNLSKDDFSPTEPSNSKYWSVNDFNKIENNETDNWSKEDVINKWAENTPEKEQQYSKGGAWVTFNQL